MVAVKASQCDHAPVERPGECEVVVAGEFAHARVELAVVDKATGLVDNEERKDDPAVCQRIRGGQGNRALHGEPRRDGRSFVCTMIVQNYGSSAERARTGSEIRSSEAAGVSRRNAT